MGRQSQSVSAWILVVGPPRERPMAWFRSPFSARGRGVRLPSGGVDERLGAREDHRRWPAHGRDRPRCPWQSSARNDCRASCVARNPAAHRSSAGRLQDMDYAADHPTMINARVGRLMWLDPRELRIRHPEAIRGYHDFLSGAVSHTMPAVLTIFWIRTQKSKSTPAG